MGKRFNLALMVAALLGFLCISHLQADDPEVKADTAAEMVKAAEGALRGTMAQYEFQQSSVEQVYQWSKRLMKAEIANGKNKSKAALDHVQRMRNVYQKAEALFKNGVKGGSEDKFHATHYYFLEAQANALKKEK
jgi:hypothetical protein